MFGDETVSLAFAIDEVVLRTGDGNDQIVLSHLNVIEELLAVLGAGTNTVSADNVTALFGFLNGGLSGNNTYNDGGGNSGYVVFNFSR